MEFFGTRRGIKFYNDSIATNPYATLAGIEALGDNLGSIILGGTSPNASYELLVEGILKYAPRARVVIMDTTVKNALIHALEGQSLPYEIAANLHEVVQLAFKHTPEKGVCLFSPAAKSYGWFKNCYERGESFKREVLGA
jgi:UDP-N-acetylmuramoylalanine--D-glutamate ligase